MKTTFIPSLLILCCGSASAWDWDNQADVSFWAPGMGNTPIYMSQVQGGGPGPQYVGNYYAYVIKGLVGSLTLGNRNQHDAFWQVSKSWHRDWGGQSSWATVGFQINNMYHTDPALFFSISGDHAGATTGTLVQMLDKPIVIKSRGNWDTSITFVPHVNPWFLPQGQGLPNKTPSADILVIADIYRDKPTVTGNLDVSSNWVFPANSVTLSWEYDRAAGSVDGFSVPAGFEGLIGVAGGGQ